MIFYKGGEGEMKTVSDIKREMTSDCVLALGCFDGVHVGHTAVIKTAVEKAKELSLPSCVWTFSAPPKKFYSKEPVPLITDEEQKAKMIEALGADTFYSIEFNESVASLTAEYFFEHILLGTLRAKYIVCGFDFTFGKGGKGNKELLGQMCERCGIGFCAIDPVTLNGNAVSSSAIREYIRDGEIEKANLLLGRPYSFRSAVVDGRRLGRKLGFPTVNQKIDPEMCVPAYGVYLTKVHFDGNQFFGITNVGTRPTVDGSRVFSETNIFDFSGDLYGKELCIEFLKFIRPEKRFSSVEELSAQVHTDISTAKRIIAESK